jgi:amino acid transporter
MSKRMVTRVFGGSLVALAAAFILLLVAGGVAYANGSFIMDGPDVVGVTSTPLTWSMIALAALAVLTMFGALIAQFVAWIGALVNTVQLPDKTWFVVLLVMGLLSFSFIAMIIYIIAGPKDPEPAPPAVLPAGPRTSEREPVG